VGTLWRAVGEDELAAQSAGINLTSAKVSAFGIGGAIAGLAGGVFAHYATHIEHNNFGILLATFAIAYPIIGGLSSLAGTLLAVIFIQGFLLEGLRFIGAGVSGGATSAGTDAAAAAAAARAACRACATPDQAPACASEQCSASTGRAFPSPQTRNGAGASITSPCITIFRTDEDQGRPAGPGPRTSRVR
jgi:hypothetical protein